MNTSSIKRIKEKNLSNSENNSQKEIEILFESSKDGISRQDTITLAGEGSVKVLLPV